MSSCVARFCRWRGFPVSIGCALPPVNSLLPPASSVDTHVYESSAFDGFERWRPTLTMRAGLFLKLGDH